jgi:hypothetical protein
MARAPLPWNHSNSAGSGAPRYTLEQLCEMWAEQHPLLAILAVWWIWCVYTGVAAIFLNGRNGRTDWRRASSGYRLGLLIGKTGVRTRHLRYLEKHAQ